MSLADILNLWPAQPALSALTWMVLLIGLLYVARAPAHRAIQTFSRALSTAMRLAAQSVMSAERRLKHRNREVLLAAGAEAQERFAEREFERVEDNLRRNLETYPSVHRRLSELATEIEDDYHNSADVPESLPAWSKAIEAIAKLGGGKDPAVGAILEDIHATMETSHRRTLTEYRKTSAERHRVLRRLRPQWRRVARSLGEFEQRLDGLMERAHVIDKHMTRFEEVRRGSESALRTLSSSSLVQFFVSSLVLLIAIGGAVINFQLIARPMAEMVGGASHIMGFPTSSVAALVIIFVEVAMGLFLMELLRITRLFPVIRALDDTVRRRLMWVCFVILLSLACIESSLAYMRDYLAAQDEALQQYLTGTAGVGYIHRWIPTVAQMVMGFVLPFALVFVAIPLETFIHSFRTVLGVSLEFLLRFTALVLRIAARTFGYLGVITVQLYDVLIFAPLWLEHRLQKRGTEDEPDTADRTDGEQSSSHPGLNL